MSTQTWCGDRLLETNTTADVSQPAAPHGSAGHSCRAPQPTRSHQTSHSRGCTDLTGRTGQADGHHAVLGFLPRRGGLLLADESLLHPVVAGLPTAVAAAARQRQAAGERAHRTGAVVARVSRPRRVVAVGRRRTRLAAARRPGAPPAAARHRQTRRAARTAQLGRLSARVARARVARRAALVLAAGQGAATAQLTGGTVASAALRHARQSTQVSRCGEATHHTAPCPDRQCHRPPTANN